MECIPKDFWTKIRRDKAGAVTSWQPLKAHCVDVAAGTEALFEHSILLSRLGHLLGQEHSSDMQIARLCVLASLHDVGKVNHGFQDRAYFPRAPRIGHVSPFIDFMNWDNPEKVEIIKALNLREMDKWFQSEDGLVAFLFATSSHHDKPIRPSSPFGPELWRDNEIRNLIGEMRSLRQAARRWFPGAFDTNTESFSHSPGFQHTLNGLLTLADRIGSDEHFFPYADDYSDRMSFARQYAREAIVRSGLAPKRFLVHLGPSRPAFEAIAPVGYSPYPIQRKCGFPRTRYDTPLLSRLRKMGVEIR
jgi:CRISPR-associated endonuclease/helicase Cas3